MSKSEGNRELLERMHYLESQLSNALEKIERTSSNELNDLRDLVKESIDANKMNIQNNHALSKSWATDSTTQFTDKCNMRMQ